MNLIIPGTELQLSQSTAIISEQASWAFLIEQLTSLVHPADIWRSTDTSTSLPIAEVKKLRNFAARSPQGTYKIAILENADQFKLDTANALLKLLEEPPSFLAIVALAETNHFTPTVASRLRQLQFRGNSATLTANDPSRVLQKWQVAFQRYDISNPKDRQKAQQLLYLQSITHPGIKPEPLIASFQ